MRRRWWKGDETVRRGERGEEGDVDVCHFMLSKAAFMPFERLIVASDATSSNRVCSLSCEEVGEGRQASPSGARRWDARAAEANVAQSAVDRNSNVGCLKGRLNPTG